MRRLVVVVSFVAASWLGVGIGHAQVRGNQYSMAGCGLGTYVFDADEAKMKQVLAATTNGTFGTQTFGISSGTSNCNPGGGPKGRRASLFIDVNREVFAKDAARGSGETIEHLSAIVGCPEPAVVGAALQRSFKVIFSSYDLSSEQVTDHVLDTLRKDESLARSCTGLGS